VGLSEREARQQGRPVRVARMPMTHVAGALEVDESRGLMKALVGAVFAHPTLAESLNNLFSTLDH
jgi:pyruvate/2-oxoglutarate dehydrogenase complex dihydrolipoamide dehydrogenase (E3) component